jgi:hypothetical protein
MGAGGVDEVFRAHKSRLIGMSRSRFPPNSSAVVLPVKSARLPRSTTRTSTHLDDVGPNYLVLEYAEGQDLRGPVDFEDALPITRSFSVRFPQP